MIFCRSWPGIALYGVMAQIHGAVIGVPVFSITP